MKVRSRMNQGTGIAVLLAAMFLLSCASTVTAQSRSFGFADDFERGWWISINNDFPFIDQMQMDETGTPLPFINIPLRDKGTILRINTETGDVIGEYRTAPDSTSLSASPDAIAIDSIGNLWVANGDEGSDPFKQFFFQGSVARIGIIIGGERVDAAGNPDPLGDYLKPPYDYNTCIDRDGDGLIRTSGGAGHVLDWSNAGEADTHGGVSTAEDEAILNYVRTSFPYVSFVATDRQNGVWVGTELSEIGSLGKFEDRVYERIDGITGNIEEGSLVEAFCGGLPGFADRRGVLWSASDGGSLDGGLFRYDTEDEAGSCINPVPDLFSRSAIGRDPITGNILWVARGKLTRLFELNRDGEVLAQYPVSSVDSPGQIFVDKNRNIWIRDRFGDDLAHFAPTAGDPAVFEELGGFGFEAITGLSVDSEGKIWVLDGAVDTVHRIDPSLIHPGGSGAIDLTIDLPPDSGAHAEGDMTGFVTMTTAVDEGSLNLVHDGGVPNTVWGLLTWDSFEPLGTQIRAFVRSAPSEGGLSVLDYVEVFNGTPLQGIVGQVIQFRFVFIRANTSETPILFSFTIDAAETNIHLTPESDTGIVGQDHTVIAAITQGGVAVQGVPVDFVVVNGPNAGASGQTQTNLAGQALFTYPGLGGVGTDSIRASYDNGVAPVFQSNIAQQVWAECFLVVGDTRIWREVGPDDVLLVKPFQPRADWIFPVLETDIPIFTIPNNPDLIGTHVYAQVYLNNMFAFPDNPIQMSNGLDILIGSPDPPSAFGPGGFIDLWSDSSVQPGDTLVMQFDVLGM